MQTSSLGRIRKNFQNINLLVCSVHFGTESQETSSGQLPRKLLSNKLSKYYSNAFKKYWNNIGTICLKVIFRTCDIFLHTGLTELHIFFVTRSTTFFSSTVFVISRLVFCLMGSPSNVYF